MCRARRRCASSTSDAEFKTASARSYPADASSSARCSASSLRTSSDSRRADRSAIRSRQYGRRSGIAHPGEIADEREELLPLTTLRREHLFPARGDRVIPPAPLPRLLDPATVDPLPFFEFVEGGVEGGEVERQRAAGSLVNQLRQLVPVKRLLVEQREDDEFRGPLLRFADRAGKFHTGDYILESGISQPRNSVVTASSQP